MLYFGDCFVCNIKLIEKRNFPFSQRINYGIGLTACVYEWAVPQCASVMLRYEHLSVCYALQPYVIYITYNLFSIVAKH